MPTRNNPTNGNLEIWHDDLNAWVTAVADLPSVGGKPVKLSSSDLALLTAIRNNTSDTSFIKEILGNNFYPEIQGINAKVTDIANTRLGAIASSIDTLQSSIDFLSNETMTLSSRVLLQTTLLQSIKDATITTTPVITNLTLINANTQYTHTFAAGTKRYAFKCRGDIAKGDTIGDVRYSWITGMVATGINNYDVLNSSSEEVSQDYFSSAKPIYFSSATAGTDLAIREWR